MIGASARLKTNQLDCRLCCKKDTIDARQKRTPRSTETQQQKTMISISAGNVEGRQRGPSSFLVWQYSTSMCSDSKGPRTVPTGPGALERLPAPGGWVRLNPRFTFGSQSYFSTSGSLTFLTNFVILVVFQNTRGFCGNADADAGFWSMSVLSAPAGVRASNPPCQAQHMQHLAHCTSTVHTCINN